MSSERKTPLLVDAWVPGQSSPHSRPEDAIASFQLLMADYLMSVEGDDERREKMRRNVDQEWAKLREVDGEGVDPRQIIYDWINAVGPEAITGLLVEVLYLNPSPPTRSVTVGRTDEKPCGCWTGCSSSTQDSRESRKCRGTPRGATGRPTGGGLVSSESGLRCCWPRVALLRPQ